MDLAAGLPWVRGDRVRLQQVMVNLIMNAVDATRAISDVPREILIRTAKKAECLVVSLEDSGTGLSPEQMERIFEPFFITKAQGIGMGLSISRSIVEIHSGKLYASRRMPRGAKFELRFRRLVPVTRRVRPECTAPRAHVMVQKEDLMFRFSRLKWFYNFFDSR